MNEAETRAELIDPKLKACGWGIVEGSKILRERNVCKITDGRIQAGGGRSAPLIADYILVYKGVKLAVVEAKSDDLSVGEGVAQAKQYAAKLQLSTTYSTNGNEIYQICMESGKEGLVEDYLSPEELWHKNYPVTAGSEVATCDTNFADKWRDDFLKIPFEDKSGSWHLRYYQELAINNTLEAIANGKNKVLLTLATGTGKTAIAFQVAWKLFHSRWNLSAVDNKQLTFGCNISEYKSRRPRILFLADRNILANQAFNEFYAFQEDAKVRISAKDIRKKGKVPTNGAIFFTIFQTFMTKEQTKSSEPKEVENLGEPHIDYVATGEDIEGREAAESLELFDEGEEYDLKETDFNFGQYPKDFFDFIIIDECHRGGANDESSWRAILDYFSPAVQLGLTATPKRDVNTNTYKYFGNPVFVYSLKEGINDGFLTPFKVKRIQTTLDDYIYTGDDEVLEGHVDTGKIYSKDDFNKEIEIIARETKNVQIYLDGAQHNDKAIIFCATQCHAALIRDLVNQQSTSEDPFYCVRVTANDGEIGEKALREFQDNEKLIPTILTTSRKLSTGVDARNIRNIVLFRKITSMVEFKQIIGRGTRLFEGKDFFTIYDYADAYHHFLDPEWDGDPLEEKPCEVCGEIPCVCETTPSICAICGKCPCVCVIVDPPTPPPNGPCDVCGCNPCICKKMVKIKLAPGKELEIQHMISTSFWGPDGKPISAQDFLSNMFGELPNLFKDEDELRTLWSNPATRKALLDKLEDAGFGRDQLTSLQQLINAEQSDLFDVLEYVFNSDVKPITRAERVIRAESAMFDSLEGKQVEFIEFVLTKYVEVGVDELDEDKLPVLLKNKYDSLEEAKDVLGSTANIRTLFINFQQYLYQSA